ncbi:MAG TPA: iron-sulfur cluster assembly accessory protein [Halothiobacillus sp.]|jgi:iron-sulfur cluster assembly accessory protein|nr:iron-sulfur cluster assembly accessory protein [Halothiobacillus sp.]
MDLTFTPKAQRFIQRMIMFNGGSATSGFRLAVAPGGCSGLSYDFSVEDAPKTDDLAIESDGIKVFLAKDSVPLLDGVIVDCEDSLINTGLVFKNPNAAESCGCGTSFTPK